MKPLVISVDDDELKPVLKLRHKSYCIARVSMKPLVISVDDDDEQNPVYVLLICRLFQTEQKLLLSLSSE